MRVNRGVKVWNPGDTAPTDAQGGYAGGDSTADAIALLGDQAAKAWQTIDQLTVTSTTGAVGSDGSVTITGTTPNKTINFVIPRGRDGKDASGVGGAVAAIMSERGWRTLRTALNAGTARVVAMGDSKTEGTGLDAISERWLNVMQASLRARYAPSGDQGLGYLPSDYFTFYGFPSETTRSATGWQAVGNGGGLGNRSIHLTAGGWVEWPAMTFAAGVPLIVHWTRIPTGASMEVLVDGTVVSTIATTGTDRSMTSTVTVSAGSHVIRVRHKASSGDAVRIEGIVHRTKTTGVIVYDAARSGGKVSDYSDGMAADGAPNSDDRHWEAVATIAPHAVILAFGANDMSSHTAQQWREDLVIAVAKAKVAAPGAGIVLLHGAQGTGDVNTAPGKILEFEAAARDAIGSDPDVSILYESQLWAPTVGVDYTAGDPSGWLAPGDTVHTSATAHAQIARYLVGSIVEVDAPSGVGPLRTPEIPVTNNGTLSLFPGYSYAFGRAAGNPAFRIAPAKSGYAYGAHLIDLTIEATGAWSGTCSFTMLTGGEYFSDTVMGSSSYTTPTLSAGVHRFTIFRNGTDWRVARVSSGA